MKSIILFSLMLLTFLGTTGSTQAQDNNSAGKKTGQIQSYHQSQHGNHHKYRRNRRGDICRHQAYRMHGRDRHMRHEERRMAYRHHGHPNRHDEYRHHRQDDRMNRRMIRS